MTKLAILRQLIKEEIEDFKNSQLLTFESDPLEYILQKYSSLDATMTDLLTPHYRDYISGVFVTAPKPTTFKILLHNGQEFYMIYGPRAYMVKVAGKKYNLINLNEEEFAIKAIAQLLELGMPPGSKGPDNQMDRAARCHPVIGQVAVVLQCTSGIDQTLLRRWHTLFGFYRLVQSVTPTTACHQPSRELVDDHNLAVLVYIVLVAVVEVVGTQCRVQVMHQTDVRGVI